MSDVKWMVIGALGFFSFMMVSILAEEMIAADLVKFEMTLAAECKEG